EMTESAITERPITSTLTATLLDPEAVSRVPSGVTWALRINVHVTIADDETRTVRLSLAPSAALAQWLPDEIRKRPHWHFDSRLLASGLDAPSGTDEIMISPAYRRDLVEIVLSADSQAIGLWIRWALLLDLASREVAEGR